MITIQKLQTLDARVVLLGEKIDNLATDLFDDKARMVVDECLQMEGILGQPLTAEEFSKCILEFRRVSTGIARGRSLTKDVSLEGTQGPTLIADLQRPTFTSIGILKRVTALPEYRTAASVAYADVSLPQPAYWAMGVQGMTALMIKYPGFVARFPPAKLGELFDAMAEPGEDVRGYFESLRDPALLSRILGEYDESVQKALGFEEGLGRLWSRAVRETLEIETEAGDLHRPTNIGPLHYCGSWPAQDMPELTLNDSFFAALPYEYKHAYMLRVGNLRTCYIAYWTTVGLVPAQFECERWRAIGGREGPGPECVKNRRTRDASCDWAFEVRALADLGSDPEILTTAVSNLGVHAATPALNADSIIFNEGNFETICNLPTLPPSIRDAIAARASQFSSVLNWQLNTPAFESYKNHLRLQIADQELALGRAALLRFIALVRDTLAGNEHGDAVVRAALDEVDFRKAVVDSVVRAGFSHGVVASDLLRGNLRSNYGLLSSRVLAVAFSQPDDIVISWLAAEILPVPTIPAKKTRSSARSLPLRSCLKETIETVRSANKELWKMKEPREELRLALVGSPSLEGNCIFRALTLYQQRRREPFGKFLLDPARKLDEQMHPDLVNSTLSELRTLKAIFVP